MSGYSPRWGVIETKSQFHRGLVVSNPSNLNVATELLEFKPVNAAERFACAPDRNLYRGINAIWRCSNHFGSSIDPGLPVVGA